MNKIISIDGGGIKILGVLYKIFGDEFKCIIKGLSNFVVSVDDVY